MEKEAQKLIVIIGPTASGKSELAVRLAKKFSGEIISADSRQVYRELDIGTGKVPGKWRQKPKVFVYKAIPHYCIDFVSPKRVFTAADFKKCAEGAIQDINRRGKIPVMAGGTGFYIDAVLYENLLPNVPPNKTLRNTLSQKSARKLFMLLKRLDPERAKNIDRKNPRRLIRAIEIAKALGRVPKFKKNQIIRYSGLEFRALISN
ncbi:MAG: tRNA (adenosine(37)-N6)-dimethylallyltransferase MiaA [Candidatus Sungbacteria bacterium]|nr:tRNA (adenosine(37)-N6)-dimethylallyltransferase MiaA [Candidatus Sungbacteria bacterium]